MRASGISTAQTVQAVARFVSSIGFGLMWQFSGRSAGPVRDGGPVDRGPDHLGLAAARAPEPHPDHRQRDPRPIGLGVISRSRTGHHRADLRTGTRRICLVLLPRQSRGRCQQSTAPQIPQTTDVATVSGYRPRGVPVHRPGQYLRQARRGQAQRPGRAAGRARLVVRTRLRHGRPTASASRPAAASSPTYGVQMLDASLQPTTSSAVDRTAQPGPDLQRRLADRDDDLHHRSFLRVQHVLDRRRSSDAPTDRCSATSRTSTRPSMGNRLTAVDKNYWGVTFVNDDEFYATGCIRRQDLADARQHARRRR